MTFSREGYRVRFSGGLRLRGSIPLGNLTYCESSRTRTREIKFELYMVLEEEHTREQLAINDSNHSVKRFYAASKQEHGR